MPRLTSSSTDPTRTANPRPPSPDSGSNRTPTIQPAEQIARFQVLGCIGVGGMGQVYAAYDPELDRKVALKVLHEDRADEHPRLVREAKALARLSHPNVVAVHEVGSHRGRVFVAMEFVEGVTLREWIREHPPGSVERLATVLELLVQAGEGLAAAHRAGLVHRDLKPGNVLIGDDGRVRVADFGLVRVEKSKGRRRHLTVVGDEDETTQAKTQAQPRQLELRGMLDDPLTRPGAMVGTPAYMAPEQFLGTKVGEATDQFGLCVTAWEAVFGTRPFPGKTVPAVLEAIRKGTPERPETVACPEGLEDALRTGLAFGPRGRHANVEALLEELRDAQAVLQGALPRPRPKRRRWWPWALVLGGVMTTGVVGVLVSEDDSALCSGGRQRLAGVWDEGVEQRLREAFEDSEASFAPQAWVRVDEQLDAYAEAWVVGHRDACEAAQVRKEQSTELMDLRMACLDDRRRDVVALTEVYAEPDVEMLARADEAIAALLPVSDCADPDFVRSRGAEPVDEDEAAAVEAIERRIARSLMHEAAGRYAEARAIADEAVADADVVGRPGPRAQALLRRGKVLARLRQADRTADDLERAYLLAEPAGLPRVRFEASRALAQTEAVLRNDFSSARWWAKVARFEAEQVDDPTALARMHIDLGSMERAQGRFVDAARSYEQAVELLRRSVGPEDLAYATALRALGELRLVRGGPMEGLPVLTEALAIAERSLGPEHPSLSRFHTVIAEAHRLGGDLDQALERIDEALRLGERAFGPDHVALHAVLEERSLVLQERGELDAAREQLVRARRLHLPEPVGDAVRARLLGREGETWLVQQDFVAAAEAYGSAAELARVALGDLHPDTARYRIGLGEALGGQGRIDEAKALIETGLAVREVVLGGEHPNVAVTHDILAAALERVGDLEGALEHGEQALAIYEAAYGANSLPLMRPNGNLCGVLGKLRRTDEAVEHCERALELATAAVSVDERLIASLHNNLGAALVAAERWDEAAREYREAKEIWERVLGPDDLMVGIVLANLGETDLARGRLRDAYGRYERSLAIREAMVGAGHPMVVVPLIGMATALVRRGKSDEAVALAQRAVAVSKRGGVEEAGRARAQDVLAQALGTNPGNGSR